MITKKNISKVYYIFICSHLVLWTLAPTLSNVNLPLDTIEALAWGSNLEWGFSKHPPLSAFLTQSFYYIFGQQDWAYYFLSQLCVIISFIYVWKFSNEIFHEKIYVLVSLLLLEGIFYYNFTTPEFNVNICQLPFWSMSVYYFWRGINNSHFTSWILFGLFSALGILSKYLFIYILAAIFLFFIFNLRHYRKFLLSFSLSLMICFIILIPHIIWLIDNNFITFFYGLNRSSISEYALTNHFINPMSLILKQLIILFPLFLMIFVLLKKYKIKLNIKSKKSNFIYFITLAPLLLILITSIVTGAKIRTMWMTPFYLFAGIFLVDIFFRNIDLKRLNRFFIVFLILFIISPTLYFTISILDETKRTDYPGKEIARLVQNKWDDNFNNEIKLVIGDEWSAGNLSYHLYSRPVWTSDLKDKISGIKNDQGIIYTGNPQVLKKICPGVFGTIKPIGYCMIGRR